MLDTINSPRDLKNLTPDEYDALCAEIRAFLVKNVAATGGHLASNLGTVELTLALHLTFDLSRDRLVFDVGHQCYTHKILTGRRDDFPTLRKLGGLSGFPRPEESEYDAFIAGHASNSVSVALGFARARTAKGENHSVLALIGDGALTGGLAYEALCDAGGSQEPIIVILNDNGMSITKNVGGMARYLSRQRVKPSYLSFKRRYRRFVEIIPGGKALYKFTHNLKAAIKRAVLRCSMFEEMGFEYLGPVDGHDTAALNRALEWARNLNAPVLLHVITRKGRGYEKAEQSPDAYHGVSHFDPDIGLNAAKSDSFSTVFGETLTRLAEQNEQIVAVTAAMTSGTGLTTFAERFPKRIFDVGIAEGHAASMTAGLANGGLLPVFAVYSTFAQRSYDQLIHDIALTNSRCVIAIDRAGIVPGDGETHQGVFDTAFLATVPGLKVYAPASFAELRDMLTRAVNVDTGAVAIRYPKGAEGAYRDGGADAIKLLREGADVTVVTYGAMTDTAAVVAKSLQNQGISAELLKLGVITPIDAESVAKSVAKTGKLVVIEDSAQAGSVGERLAAQVRVPALLLNTGEWFLPGGTVAELRKLCGLDAETVATRIMAFCRG
ncbi:MAG: 1-deoxy-D-xylulose-5-phosphate synthase [Oscillospiraceae bacterium]|nr:1-deoxy-D-xylulose-5-phosphate synthase [Oscillospiraceae bacterium]